MDTLLEIGALCGLAVATLPTMLDHVALYLLSKVLAQYVCYPLFDPQISHGYLLKRGLRSNDARLQHTESSSPAGLWGKTKGAAKVFQGRPARRGGKTNPL